MAWRTIGSRDFGVMVYLSRPLVAKIRGFGRSPSNPPPPTPIGVVPATTSSDPRDLRQRVNELEWYHSIELTDGVVTPGLYDLRAALPQYPLPPRLDGMRVLDVATNDGFWAFEFERRGAAEVVAIDIDDPAKVDLPPRLRRAGVKLSSQTMESFWLAHAALRSKVRREIVSVYDLSPERLGMFDFVFVSDLLLHLANPMKALDNICRVTRGSVVIVDTFHPHLPGRLMSYEGGETDVVWWVFSLGALEQMIRDAGFSRVELRNRFQLGPRTGSARWWRAAFEAWP